MQQTKSAFDDYPRFAQGCVSRHSFGFDASVCRLNLSAVTLIVHTFDSQKNPHKNHRIPYQREITRRKDLKEAAEAAKETNSYKCTRSSRFWYVD